MKIIKSKIENKIEYKQKRKKKIKTLKVIILLVILLLIYVYIANITLLPKSFIIMQNENLNLFTLWGIDIKQADKLNTNKNYEEIKTVQASADTNKALGVGKIDLNLNLFNIPLKDVTVNVIPNTKVIPLGDSIGLKLYTDGVLIVGKSEIDGEKPYENVDIKEGDMIISINETQITSTADLIQTVNSSQGKEISLIYQRDNETKTASITPIKTEENEYKLGLWVRDAAAGVGTSTFYEPSTKSYACLGHGITDVDTGALLTIANGELVSTNIVSIIKGQKGTPGELKGTIDKSQKIGDVYKNTNFGVFGKIKNQNNLNITQKEMEVASRDEIKTGKAQIICEIEANKKEYYDIEIEKIYIGNNRDNKSMLIRVTDEKLLEQTGGIIQGMSGSPIIQNGKFIGAVTHVLVQDPTQGYAVFGDLMIKEMREVK